MSKDELIEIAFKIHNLSESKTKIKSLEKDVNIIVFEYGKYLIGALITEENLISIRNKLKELIQTVEEFYKDELE